MITAYTGTPGSGKSLHTSYIMWDQITLKHKRLIYNKYLNTVPLEKKLGRKKGKEKLEQRLLIVDDDKKLTPKLLINYALKYHVPGKESQSLIIIEEAANFFSKEEFRHRPDYFEWRRFAREHRQYGFDMILVTQRLNWIDAGIAGNVEYEVNHRNVANFKMFGKFVSKIFGGVFSYSERWVAIKPSVWNKGGMFILHRDKAKIYRSMEAINTDTNIVKVDKHAKISGFADEYFTPKHSAAPAVSAGQQLNDSDKTSSQLSELNPVKVL